MEKIPKYILPTIVIAQFCCTSLWFAGNSVLDDLIVDYQLSENSLGWITSSVQFGFIVGTLLFALLLISDKFSPSKIFFFCALLGGFINLGLLLKSNSLYTLLTIRFFTGFFLAGIYPVGMKIAADYFDKKLGKALGFLVGALVLGTAFPHLLRSLDVFFDWKWVIIITSFLAFLGGLSMMLFVKNGPYRKKGSKIELNKFFKVFKDKSFKAAAFGYFGHMWELYTFWAFAPTLLTFYIAYHKNSIINISFWAFVIISIGFFGCVVSGFLALKHGARKMAYISLLSSGICCLLFPVFFIQSSLIIYISFLLFWGFVVIADSPMFSTLVAKRANPKYKGTALTIVNCIGFSITIISIEVVNFVFSQTQSFLVFTLLFIGPLFGLIFIYKNKHNLKSL